MLEFKIKIDKKSLKSIEDAPDEFRRGLLEGMNKSMKLAELTTKNRMGRSGEIGIKSGRLRRSIRSQVKQRGSSITGVLFSNVIYARIHELGGTIRPKISKYLKFKIGDRWISAREVNIPARPYLRPSIEENVEDIKDLIVSSIIKETG